MAQGWVGGRSRAQRTQILTVLGTLIDLFLNRVGLKSKKVTHKFDDPSRLEVGWFSGVRRWAEKRPVLI